MTTVSLSPFAGAGAQFLDSTGNVLSGGKIFTYAAGTTTPLPSYTTADGLTAHANPIVLDSAGRVPSGQIWLLASDSYKFTLETAAGVLIASYDNISAIAFDVLPVNKGGTGATTPSAAQSNLGATTVGGSFFTLANPSAIRFPRINADNTVTARAAEDFLVDIGAAASGVNADITSLEQSTTIAPTGVADVDSLGFRGLPQESKTAAYTLALGDAGRHISITTGGVTIPADGTVAFPIGTTIVVYNNSSSAQNIAITTDTLRLAGTATTGTRSLAQRGLATLVKVAATEWAVTGNVS
jgi:hypothetical protein